MCFVFARFEEAGSAGRIEHSYLIGRFNNVFKVVDRTFSIFDGEEGSEIGSVRWYPDKDTKPVTASKNAPW